MLRGKKISKEICHQKRFSRQVTGGGILSEVSRKLKVSEKEIRETKKRGYIARELSIYLMKKHSDMSNNEIAAIFGGMHPSAITKIAQRTEAKIGNDEDFKKTVFGLISIFKA